MKNILLAIALFVFGTSSIATALESNKSDSLKKGDRIKVVTKIIRKNVSHSSRRRGKSTSYQENIYQYENFTDKYLIYVIDGRTDSITTGQINAIFVSRGIKSNFGKGFKYGAITGLATGIVLGFAVDNLYKNLSYNGTFGDKLAIGVPLGIAMSVITGLIGGVVGASIKTETWKEIEKDSITISLNKLNNEKIHFALRLNF